MTLNNKWLSLTGSLVLSLCILFVASTSVQAGFICMEDVTIYVEDGFIVGGNYDGEPYEGILIGTDGDDVIRGTEETDTILGNDGHDIICGRSGDDAIWGGDGYDMIYGGAGNDDIFGGEGMDFLYGGAGDDLLKGGPEDDFMLGGPDRDMLYGEADNDMFGCGVFGKRNGRFKRDVAIGGRGEDMMYKGTCDAARSIEGELDP